MKHAHTRYGWVKGSHVHISADLRPQLPNPSYTFPGSQDVSLRLRFYRRHPPLPTIFTSVALTDTTGGPETTVLHRDSEWNRYRALNVHNAPLPHYPLQYAQAT